MAAPPDCLFLRPLDEFGARPDPAQLFGDEEDIDIEGAPERTTPKATDRHVSSVLKQDSEQVSLSVANGLLVEIPQSIPEALESACRWFVGQNKATLHTTLHLRRADDRGEHAHC